MRVIVYNRHSDGGVSVCNPSDWCIAMMGSGGMWSDQPRGYLDTLIERSIANGRNPDISRRFVRAMHFGGCTTAEALEIIRDRDCTPHGSAIELFDRSELPADRWFRNAWRRSHNGGPIDIDIKKARPIQFQHIRQTITIENKKRLEGDDWDAAPLEIDLAAVKSRLLAAKSLPEIRSIWPTELTRS